MQVDMTLDQMVSSNWGASARPEVLGRPAAAAGLVLPCSQGHARRCHQKPAASNTHRLLHVLLAPRAGGLGAELERICPVLLGARCGGSTTVAGTVPLRYGCCAAADRWPHGRPHALAVAPAAGAPAAAAARCGGAVSSGGVAAEHRPQAGPVLPSTQAIRLCSLPCPVGQTPCVAPAAAL